MGGSHLILKAFSRINNTKFSNWTSIGSSCCFHFYIPDQSVISWKYLYNSSGLPLSSNSVRISKDNPIINTNISTLSVPFLPWNQMRQYFNGPSFPEGIYNSLTEFKSMPWVFCFTKRSLWNSISRSTEENIVGTEIGSVVWILR